MRKMFAFVIVFCFISIAFAQELPKNEQSVAQPVATEQPAPAAPVFNPEKDIPVDFDQCMASREVCLMKCVNKMGEEVKKGKSEVDKKIKDKKPKAAGNAAYLSAKKIKDEAENLPAGKDKEEIVQSAKAVMSSTSSEDELKRYNELVEKILGLDKRLSVVEGKVETLEEGQNDLSVKLDKETERLDRKIDDKAVYGLANFGFMVGLNKGLADMSLGLGIGIPFKYFTIEGGVSGGLDLVTNNLTTMLTAGMIFPMKDWGDKGELSFLVNGLFYSVIKLPEDNVNRTMMGLGYYGGGNLGVRHVLPVGEKKVGLLFQAELDAMYGEGRGRTAVGWERKLEPIVAVRILVGVLF